MKALPWGAAVALLLFLAACGGILPAPEAPPQLHRLTAAVDFPASLPPASFQLLVNEPEAPGGLDTTRIALIRGTTSVDYFAGAAWTDRVPEMVRSLLVESLENSGRVTAVASQSLSLRSDYVLQVEVRHFEADYQGDGAPTVQVELDVRLIRMSDGSIVAQRRIARSAPAARNDIAGVIDAFNEAGHAVLAETVGWAVQSMAAVH